MPKDLEFVSENGGYIVVRETEMEWMGVDYGEINGYSSNTVALRQFLRRALARLEKAARKGKR